QAETCRGQPTWKFQKDQASKTVPELSKAKVILASLLLYKGTSRITGKSWYSAPKMIMVPQPRAAMWVSVRSFGWKKWPPKASVENSKSAFSARKAGAANA